MTRARSTTAGALAALLCACGGADAPQGRAARFDAPPSVRATLVLEPPVLEIGEVTVAELAVVTPPEHRVLPIAPVELPGLWLLGVRALPTLERDGRTIHRTEWRIRPRELGTHTWPATTVRVESPEGTVETLSIAPREFEVTSVRDRFADREEPFGLERLDDPEPSRGSFGAGLATGLGAAASVALCALLFRRSAAARAERAASARARGERPETSLGDWATRELARALDAVDRDPRAAANQGARVLRTWVARRYGADTEAATTEELRRLRPTLATRALWPDFVATLHRFDDVRFRPDVDADERRLRARRALDDALRLVDAASTTRGGVDRAPRPGG